MYQYWRESLKAPVSLLKETGRRVMSTVVQFEDIFRSEQTKDLDKKMNKSLVFYLNLRNVV